MIEVFGDISCPFTHVGLLRVVARRDQLGSAESVRVKAWPLELVNGEPLSPSLVAAEVAELRAQVAPDRFAGLDEAHLPATTLPALALAAAAYRIDLRAGEQISLGIRHALFDEGQDVGSRAVLERIADAHGIDIETADEADVVAEWHEGQRRGVEGSPYFFAKQQGFFCPSLDIEHGDGRLRITRDEAGLEHFLDVAFG
jgi:predicted DsbA family dithiol-disulfide isomerase